MAGPFYEKGKYAFEVTNQGFGEADLGDGLVPFFFLEGKPVTRIVDENTEEPCDTQYLRTIKLFLTDKDEGKNADAIMAIGWDGKDWSDLEPASPKYKPLVGKIIDAVCLHKPGKNKNAGKFFENWYLPLSGGGGTPTESNKSIARKVQTLFGKNRKAAVAAAGAAAKVEERAAENGGDEVPW